MRGAHPLTLPRPSHASPRSGKVAPPMISYDVLTRAIADWKAGVRPSHGSGPHHAASAAAPVYDYAAEAESADVYEDGAVEATEVAEDAPADGYDAQGVPNAESAEYGESGAEVIEDVASGIVDVEET